MTTFHPGAQAAYNAEAEELLQGVKALTKREPPRRHTFQIHPVAIITEDQIIGEIQTLEHELDGFGNELGRFWNAGGQSVGWSGEEFQRLKRLAERISKSKELEGRVSEPFILNEIFTWLRQKLECKRSDSISEYISRRCDEEIRDHNILIPLCRTYCSKDFQLGDVEFKSISKAMLDGWFANKPKDNPEMLERLRQFENETRASFQGTLAASITIRAEPREASERALEMALTASSFLRFLSKANWTSKIKSFALPVGLENSKGWHSFHLTDGKMTSLANSAINEGPHEWVLDEIISAAPELLDGLSDLAKTQNSRFRKELFESLLIYSKNTTTTDPSDKLVFVLVALEAMLLKDASEPIQGNLAERMAFLVGNSLAERKRIVTVAKRIYGMRSKFIHHGQGMDDQALLEEFLHLSWLTFAKLLDLRKSFGSRVDLLNKLDEAKLS